MRVGAVSGQSTVSVLIHSGGGGQMSEDIFIYQRGKGLLRGLYCTVYCCIKKYIHKNYNYHYIVYVLHIPV